MYSCNKITTTWIQISLSKLKLSQIKSRQKTKHQKSIKNGFKFGSNCIIFFCQFIISSPWASKKNIFGWIYPYSYKTLFHSSVNIYLPYFLIFSGHQGFKCIYHNFSAWETEIKFKYMQLLTFTWSRDTIIIQLQSFLF